MLVLLVVQGLMGYTRLRREAWIVEQELRRDHRILGAALVTALAEGEGRPIAAAQALLDEVEFAEREIRLSVELGGVSDPTQMQVGRDLVTELPLELAEGPARLVLREPMIEVERVASEGRSELLARGTLLLSLGLLAAALGGQAVVGARMEQLVRRSRAIGRGELAPGLELPGRDEIATFGRALEALAQQLDEARGRAEAEQIARQAAVEQLRHADRMRLVGDLAAGIAHELGSPLHVIAGNAGLLLADGELSVDQRETAEDIRGQTERMAGLVKRLLELAHPQPPSEAIEPLADIWEDLRSTGEGLVRGTGVRLVVSDPPEVAVRLRPALLVQAMANLIRNAVQAQPQGGAVRVSATPRDGTVELVVEDDGPGVPELLHERVFAPFYTTKPPGEGLGLGLPLVRGVIEEVGGSVKVGPSVSGGARFVVTLPTEEPV